MAKSKKPKFEMKRINLINMIKSYMNKNNVHKRELCKAVFVGLGDIDDYIRYHKLDFGDFKRIMNFIKEDRSKYKLILE